MKKIISFVVVFAALISCEAQSSNSIDKIEKTERCSSNEYLRGSWLRHKKSNIEYQVVMLTTDKDGYWIQISNYQVINTEDCINEFEFTE